MTDYGVRGIFSYYEYLEVLVGLAINGNELDILREGTLGEQLPVVAKCFSYRLSRLWHDTNGNMKKQ
eukprot:2169585-Karenia_brevis.AAC.1